MELLSSNALVQLFELNAKDFLVITPFKRELFDKEDRKNNLSNANACFVLLKNCTVKELEYLKNV